MNLKNKINIFINKLFSVAAAGIYMVLIGIIIGIATFIENDFGTSAAQKVIFQSTWFEIILWLFGITVVVNIFKFKMYRLQKWPVFLFHLSLLFILLGAGITRYFGIEGSMHIREGSSTNKIISREPYLNFDAIYKNNKYKFNEKVLFASLGNNRFKKSYQLGDKILNIELQDYIPNPEMSVSERKNGKPVLKVVVAGKTGREDKYLKQGEINNFGGVIFNFGKRIQNNSINIKYENDSLFIMYNKPLQVMVMTTREKTTLEPNIWHPLKLKALHTGAGTSIVFKEFFPKAEIKWTSGSRKMDNRSDAMLKMTFKSGEESKTVSIIGGENFRGTPQIVTVNGISIAASYGPKDIYLPFAIKLKKFILKRYAGTNNPSSYESKVTVLDKTKNIKFDYHIYMNHILNYGGYRFFQSSYDPDEAGTILSVNKDYWGTLITYLGYFLLTLGLVASLFVKNGRMRVLGRKLEKLKNS